MRAFKIFDVSDGSPKTLFHGVRGRRKLPLNEWIEAEKKMVTDGSRQTPYESGFHVYETNDDILNWLRGAKNLKNRVVVRVNVEDCVPKPRAVRPTLLASRMLIKRRDWEKRITAEDYLKEHQ